MYLCNVIRQEPLKTVGHRDKGPKRTMKNQNMTLIVTKETEAKWNSIYFAYWAAHNVLLKAMEKGIYCTMRVHPKIHVEVSLYLDYPKQVVPFNDIVASKRRYRSMTDIDYKTGLLSYTRVVEFTFSL